MYGLGLTLGPTIGGFLITLGGWPLIFLINVPIGIIGIFIVAYFVPTSVITQTKQNFDIIGTFLLTITLACFTFGVTLSQNNNINSNQVLILLIISIFTLIVFLRLESRLLEPMLDLKIFRSLEFSLGLIAIACLLISTFNTNLTLLKYLLAIIPYGLGVGMFQSPNNSVIMGAAPKEQLGIASGLLSLARILGQSIGVPLVGAVFSLVTIANAKLSFNIDVSDAPITALVIGSKITFLAMATFLFISTILTVSFSKISENE